MSTSVKERITTKKKRVPKKMEPWEVVMVIDFQDAVQNDRQAWECALKLLKDHFRHFSSVERGLVLASAIRSGQALLLDKIPQDVAETKAGVTMAERDRYHLSHSDNVEHIKFIAHKM